MPGMDHDQHQMSGMKTMEHKNHGSQAEALGKAGFGSTREITHVASETGPHVDMRAESPQSGLNDPGIGLRNHQQNYGRRVLTYADIANLYSTHDPREPTREIELHLTGNMSRYMWSMNGIKFTDAPPLLGSAILFIKVDDKIVKDARSSSSSEPINTPPPIVAPLP